MNVRKRLRDQAEAGKQAGMTLAANAKPDKVAMLRALLVSSDGTATIDDATADLAAEFTDGGKWRGTVCRSLAVAGIIDRVAVVKSDRPSRHRGYVTRWRICDRRKAALLLSRLVAAMDSRLSTAATLATAISETPTVAAAGASVQNSLPGFQERNFSMGLLTDILAAGGFGGDAFSNTWNSTQAADEFAPLPAGEYVCHADKGELRNARKGTPGYCLTFKVIEGDLTGRLVWLDLFLTPAALPMAKRDLLKLGIDSPEKMEQPLPAGIRCKVKVGLRRNDSGNETNRVVRFDAVGIDAPTVDPFAPADDSPTTDKLEGGGDES